MQLAEGKISTLLCGVYVIFEMILLSNAITIPGSEMMQGKKFSSAVRLGVIVVFCFWLNI